MERGEGEGNVRKGLKKEEAKRGRRRGNFRKPSGVCRRGRTGDRLYERGKSSREEQRPR